MISAAVDLGGTRIKLGLLDESGLKYFKIIPASPEKGLADLLPVLKDEIMEAVKSLNIDVKHLSGIGLSFPGLVDSINNKILSAPSEKYSDAVNVDLNAWGKNCFSLPVVIENDANMALLGEWKYGAGRGCDNIVMVTLGTGIGTSVIINGMPLRGAHFQAGCLGGHFTLDVNAGECICGNLGCIEMKASASALPNMLKAEGGSLNGSSLEKEINPDYKKIFEHASAGDKFANMILERSLNVWGIALVNLIHAYDPEIIILSGGITSSDHMIIPRLQQYTDRYAWTPWGKVKLIKAMNQDSAALFGAHYKLNFQSFK